MSGSEIYGGQCPHCHKAILQKHNSSLSGLMFDACPWCGFCNGEIDRCYEADSKANSKKLWDIILSHFLSENYQENRFKQQLNQLRIKLNIDEDTLADNSFYPTIFKVGDNDAKLFIPHSGCVCSSIDFFRYGCTCF